MRATHVLNWSEGLLGDGVTFDVRSSALFTLDEFCLLFAAAAVLAVLLDTHRDWLERWR